MVSFATLILTLVAGVHPVEVMVDRSVDVVEIRLDGEVVGHLAGEPWRLEVDFGDTLQPHELVAVARDAGGRELSRARQMVNLPRRRAEMTLSLDKGPDGRYRTARAAWESVEDLEVEELRALFDGSPVEVAPSGHIQLPSYDPDVLHHLVAQVRFEGDLQAESAVSLGGRYGETSYTELTSIAVELREGYDELPPARSLGGWFRLRGHALTVMAVDRPPASVLLVRDRSAEAHLPLLAGRMKDRKKALRGAGVRDGLKRDDTVHLVDTVPTVENRDRDQDTWLFPMSPDLARYRRGRGVVSTLTTLKLGGRRPGKPRLGHAVATTALQAASLGSPRAVVLVLGPTAADDGFHHPRNVLGYLETLQVPFFLWSVGGGDSPLTQEWGGATDISYPDNLLAALGELRAVLDRQRIIWVEGQHLPQQIELSASAQDHVELAGRSTRVIRLDSR